MRFVLALAATLSLTTHAQTLSLIPQPREVAAARTVALPQGLQINCPNPCDIDDLFAIADLKATLAARGIATTTNASAPHILILRNTTPLGRQTETEAAHGQPAPADFRAEGYSIVPDQDGIAVSAATSAGIFYALQTAKQLITGDGPAAQLHTATIRDWPALQYRGLHDDLSRGPIPTLDFQKKLIRTLAAYKINIYSPYFENTQAYPSNPLIGAPGASLSADDARAITAYAAQFHITVIPEQEAFGHLRKFLINEQYQPLAETPHGSVLAPGQPGSLTLITQMFTDLAQLYPGPFLHVGADETFDLGVGQTRAAVDASSLGAVYLDFMQRIVAALHPLHRKILFWGDIAQDSPALVKALPQSFKDGVIAVAWGYSPNPKGFDKQIRPFTDAGLEVWISPSINNYRQVYPNQQLALDDIQGFTRDGQRLGATGQLNTLWNDDGESLANQNWYGILFGAAAAWQKGESSIPAFQAAFGPVFTGDASGLVNQAEQELTAAMDTLQSAKVIAGTEGSDGLFWVDPWTADGQVFAAKLRPVASPIRLHAEKAIALLAQARSENRSLRETDALDAMDYGARRIDFLALKFQLADEMAAGYISAYKLSLIPPAQRKDIRPGVNALLSDINGVNGRLQDILDGYAALRDGFEQQWLRSNRPANLRPVLAHFDQAMQLWYGRIDKARIAQRQYSTSRSLPPAAALDMPSAPITP